MLNHCNFLCSVKKNLQMKKYILLITYLFISPFYIFAQVKYYSDPLKIPILLSGSFAELRNNHFHSGIDIKTQGVTGIPVYSVADGYISRIVVSPSGFGRAVYIAHTNGTTSVYGHLSRFRGDIQRYIKNIQYQRKSFRIDIQISGNTFPVSKDDLIGYSGNTGSSGGPHLHFEIRDSYTQETLNPLKYNFSVKDNTPPEIFSLMITPVGPDSHVEFTSDKKVYPVIFSDGGYRVKKPVIPVFGKIGFAVQVNDFFDGSGNKCGVYSIELTIDDELYYAFQMDRFSFIETRYLNSHIDYEEYITSKRRYHKTWLDQGNRLGIYQYVRGNGLSYMNDGKSHDIRIEIGDIHGNTSILSFSVKSIFSQIAHAENNFSKLIRYNQKNSFFADSILIKFPKESIYKDLKFMYKKNSVQQKCISGIHVVHEKTVPLHKRVKLSIQTRPLKKILHSKALLVNVDTVTGDLSAVGGYYKNGWVTGYTRTFGNFAVAVDTVPPEIVPLNIRNKSELTEYSRICFRIKDKLSGISSFEGVLDGKWALFEYDAKSNLLIHYFDEERFEMNKMHDLKLTVTDLKGNISIYEASFRK